MSKIHEVHLAWQVSSEVENKSEEECELIDVIAKTGSHVEKHDALAVIESAKATEELESPVAGEVKEIFLTAGQTYHYGTLFCKIEET